MKKYHNLIPTLRKIAETSKNHSISIQETLIESNQFGFSLIAIFWLFFSVFYFNIFFFGIYLLSLERMQHLPDWVNLSS